MAGMEATQLFQMGLGLRNARMMEEEKGREQKFASDVDRAYSDYAKRLDAGEDPTTWTSPRSRAELAGFGRAMEAQQAKSKMTAVRDQLVDQAYTRFRDPALMALGALKKGDMQTFRTSVDQASRMAPLPYRYVWDDKAGAFTEEFRSDKAGGYVATGRSVDDAYAGKALEAMLRGERMDGGRVYNPLFAQVAPKYMAQTQRQNARVFADPKAWETWTTKEGRRVSAIPQNNVFDYDQPPHYLLFEEGRGIVGSVENKNAAMAQGWTPMQPKAEPKGMSGSAYYDPNTGQVRPMPKQETPSALQKDMEWLMKQGMSKEEALDRVKPKKEPEVKTFKGSDGRTYRLSADGTTATLVQGQGRKPMSMTGIATGLKTALAPYMATAATKKKLNTFQFMKPEKQEDFMNSPDVRRGAEQLYADAAAGKDGAMMAADTYYSCRHRLHEWATGATPEQQDEYKAWATGEYGKQLAMIEAAAKASNKTAEEKARRIREFKLRWMGKGLSLRDMGY